MSSQQRPSKVLALSAWVKMARFFYRRDNNGASVAVALRIVFLEPVGRYSKLDTETRHTRDSRVAPCEVFLLLSRCAARQVPSLNFLTSRPNLPHKIANFRSWVQMDGLYWV